MARIRWQSGAAVSRDNPEMAHPVFGELLDLAFHVTPLAALGRLRATARQTALTPLAAFSNKVAQICHGTKTGTFRLRDRGRVANGGRGKDGGGFLDFFLRFPRRLKSGFLRALYVFLPVCFANFPPRLPLFRIHDVPENLRNAR